MMKVSNDTIERECRRLATAYKKMPRKYQELLIYQAEYYVNHFTGEKKQDNIVEFRRKGE